MADKAKDFNRIQIHLTFPLEEFILIVFRKVLYPKGAVCSVMYFLEIKEEEWKV